MSCAINKVHLLVPRIRPGFASFEKWRYLGKKPNFILNKSSAFVANLQIRCTLVTTTVTTGIERNLMTTIRVMLKTDRAACFLRGFFFDNFLTYCRNTWSLWTGHYWKLIHFWRSGLNFWTKGVNQTVSRNSFWSNFWGFGLGSFTQSRRRRTICNC